MTVKNIIRKLVPLKIRQKIHDIRTVDFVKKELADMKSELLYYKVLYYHASNPSTEYASEISYLKQLGTITPFPYRQVKPLATVATGFDDKKQLPYVMHGNKKLFFPAAWSPQGAKHMYTNYIATENILGGGYTEKAPHQYLTENFVVKQNDIVIDVGAAEGLFLLDVIDRVKKAYIFEPDPGWLTTLKATFEPYMDKVTIIEKFATNQNSATEATLDSCIADDADCIFIKMDVEGYEQQVLGGAQKLLTEKKDIRVACCTYHKSDDAQTFKQFFEQQGFQTEFSDGYMLFPYDDQIKPPYFRKGVIRAFKAKL